MPDLQSIIKDINNSPKESENTDVELQEALDSLNPVKEEKDKTVSMDELTLMKFNDQFNVDFENREKIDWQWLVFDAYVSGNHFVKWNDVNQELEYIPSHGALRFPINKIYSTLRSVKGFVTKYDPKWEVFAANKSTQAIDEAKYKQKLLDDYWYLEGLRAKTKMKVETALKYSIGILELGWDKENNAVTFTPLDPYNVYFGGGEGEYATRVTKTVKRRLEDIENDPKYESKKGSPETTTDEYASLAKNLLLQMELGKKSEAKEDEGVIVKETFYTLSKPNSKGGMVNIATYTQNSFLRHIETDYDSIWDIFQIYKTDWSIGKTYGEGWVKNLIPVNKALDILESQVMEYHHMFAKGRYVVPRNSGVKIINNENGVILEHNPGKRPLVENAPPVASSVDNQIQRLNVYLEDIGGQHDASLGRLPTGVTSGVAIESLQEGDANNLKDLREYLEIDLVNTARATFKMIAKRLKTTKLVECDDLDADGRPNHFAIIGESAENKPETVTLNGETIPVVVIRYKEKVRVTVNSWLAYTKEAMESRVYKHYTAGMIDRQTALESLHYTDVDGIVSRAMKEQMIKGMLEGGPPQEGDVPQEESPEQQDDGEPGGIPTPPII